MKQSLLILFISMSSTLFAQVNNPQFRNPQAKKENVQDEYFGKTIQDPYRWLEDDNSLQTAEWVKMQNNLTQTHLNQIPNRDLIQTQMRTLWNYTKYSSPFKEGEYYLFYKNEGLQNQSVLYIQKGLNGTPTEFLNPNTINAKGTSSLGSISLSKKQTYCAYSVSNAGSDWQEIYIMDVASKKHLKDTIRYSKFSGISWIGESGFYYSGYDKPKNESEKYSAKTEYQKIFFRSC